MWNAAGFTFSFGPWFKALVSQFFLENTEGNFYSACWLTASGPGQQMKYSYSWIIPSFTITDWSSTEKSAQKACRLLLLGREEIAVSGWDRYVRKAKIDFWERLRFNVSFVIHPWCYVLYSWERFIKYHALFKKQLANFFFPFSFKSRASKVTTF